MTIVGKRAESSDPRHSFSAATFRKVLKGFEIGGLPYTEVQFQLKRLLATGASPGELREVLRRSELIEPLPEYAYREVQSLLDEAIAQSAALQPDPDGAVDQEEEVDPAVLAAELEHARSALESERARTREAEEALSERSAVDEAVRSRLDMTLRESERYQAELRAARSSVASRDKVIAQMRRTLDERDAELATSRTELATARAERERLLTDSDALNGAVRESLESRDKTLAEMRQALAERESRLGALQREHAQTLASLESRGKSAAQLQADLQASRAQAASAAAESSAARRALEEKLQAAEWRVDALNTELRAGRDSIAAGNAQLAKLQKRLRDGDARIEKLSAAVRNETERAKQWQAVARHRESGAPLMAPEVEVAPQMEFAPQVEGARQMEGAPQAESVRQAEAASRVPAASRVAASVDEPLDNPFKVRGGRWNFRATPRAAWIGALLVLFAAALWFVAHRPAPVPSKPVVAAAAAIQPGTAIRDCPTCPALTVLPTGRFQQGSAATENSSAFEKPPHWVMISRSIALSTNAVTVDEFRAFVAATGRDMQGCDTYDGDWRHRDENSWENPGFAQTGSHPVTCTSWNDAKAYAAWLSAKTGQHYRLPSASEWEYAARAGAAAAQPWSADGSGACASANVADLSAGRRFPGWAVFACNDGYVQTAPVGSFKANSFGLNDMLGNVFQWTEDCWNPDYKGAPIDGAARMTGDCAERELRGGSWFSSPTFVRANYRNHFGVDYRTSSVGIRLARDIAP